MDEFWNWLEQHKNMIDLSKLEPLALGPEPELKLMQGFPEDYIITTDYLGRKYPVAKQTARIGNSVVPIMAEKLVRANMEE